jgi:hypothetical protein
MNTYIVFREAHQISKDDVRNYRGHVLQLPFKLVLVQVAQLKVLVIFESLQLLTLGNSGLMRWPGR